MKRIENIVVGDEVKSMNTTTGEIAYKRVLETNINHFDSVGIVSLVDDQDGSETHLSVTAEHPFYDLKKGWVHASKLSAGDLLIEDDGGTLRVTNVTFHPGAPKSQTYNFTVADFHTYFVGEDGVLVHNGRIRGRLRAHIFRLKGTLSIYCQGPANSIDHYEPQCRGGSDHPDNLFPACNRCNSSKGGRNVVEWLRRRGLL